jgi:hypothetical protein
MISSTVGGSGGYRRPMLRGGSPRWKVASVAGGAAPAGAVQQRYGLHNVLLWTTIDLPSSSAQRTVE